MIDVFICTYNPNASYLKRTVEGVLAQKLNKAKWSLTIIDNNSKEPVGDIGFIRDLNVKTIFEPTPGLTAARKCALNAAKGDILVFVDDDNVLDQNYLTIVDESFKNNPIGIISGNILPEYIKKPDVWFYLFEDMLAIRRLDGAKMLINSSPVFNNRFPIGAGMSIRKNLMADYYNQHLNDDNYIEGRKGNELSSGEDLDLDFYALHKGYEIGLNPLMKLIHIIPENRITVKYIQKLSASSLKSAYQLNQKWYPVFNHHVFDVFEMKPAGIKAKMAYNYLLGIFNKRKRIRYTFLKTLLGLIK